jgi:hypothetical protein
VREKRGLERKVMAAVGLLVADNDDIHSTFYGNIKGANVAGI